MQSAPSAVAGGFEETMMKKKLASIIALIMIASQTVTAQAPIEQPDLTIDAKARAEVIEGIINNLNRSYIFPETAKKMEAAIRDRASKKEYDQITSAKAFAAKLTSDLQEVSRDKHLRVRYSHEPIPVRERRPPTPEEIEEARRSGQRINFGFEKVERLGGNIGYLEMMGFFDAALGGETAAAAMGFLANTDALIIDLRRNGGGSPAMVALVSSYLFDDTVHLNSLYFRPSDSTRQWWTLPHVPGRKFGGKKDVYVLTSSRTFSAAEEFTYNLQCLKRATIIGETTGGGAHPGGVERVHQHFSVFIPSGRAINPITKTNWEGTGVKPDVEAPAGEALKTAQLMALKKLDEKNTDPRMAEQYKRLIETTQKELDDLKKGQKTAP
jgi:C-terminal processing protease CtpA/Prc